MLADRQTYMQTYRYASISPKLHAQYSPIPLFMAVGRWFSDEWQLCDCNKLARRKQFDIGPANPFPSPSLPPPPLPLLPFPSASHSPSFFLPSLPLEVVPLKYSYGVWVLRERCKLPQRGLGRSPSGNRIWCILAWKASNVLIFLRTNRPQCMHFSTCVFVHFAFTYVKITCFCLSSYWSGSRPVCRTCSYARDKLPVL